MIIKLVLQNNIQCVSPVVSLIETLANEKGFSEKESYHLQLAVEEVLTNVVQYAFEVDSESVFDVSIEDSVSGIEVVIKEKGIPFSLDSAPHFDPKKIRTINDAVQQKGLGLYISSKMVEVFDQRYLGVEGKITTIVKYQENLNVTQYKYPTINDLDKGDIVVDMHKFREADALGVARCLYTAYGYTYLKTALYNPEYIIESSKSPDCIIFTGVTTCGVVAAVCIAKTDDMLKGVMEVGSLVVSPNYRNMKLADRVITCTIEGVKRIKGINGIIADCVTIHTASQIILIRTGAYPCCVMVNRLPGTSLFKKFDKLPMERQTLVCQYKELKGRIVNVYLPDIYRAEILKIYKRLKISILELTKANCNTETYSEINVLDEYPLGTVTIYVSKIGDDLLQILNNITADSVPKKLWTLYLYLPLNDARINDAIIAAKKAEYIFGGIFSGVESSEYFLMQRVIKYDPCFEEISIFSEKDQWMLDLIELEYNQLNK